MPAKTRGGLKPIIVYVPEGLHAEIEAYAQETTQSVSMVTRRLLVYAWKSLTQGTKGTAWVLPGDGWRGHP